MRAIDEASCLAQHRAEKSAIAELVRQSRELLNTIEREIAESRCVTASEARESLAQLRGRLQSLENYVTPARH
jgi:hypothetical protein